MGHTCPRHWISEKKWQSKKLSEKELGFLRPLVGIVKALKEELKSIKKAHEDLKVEGERLSGIGKKLSIDLKKSNDKFENFITTEVKAVEPIKTPALINKKRVINFLDAKKISHPEWSEAFTSIINFIRIKIDGK